MKEVGSMPVEKNSLSILLGYLVIMLCQLASQKIFWSSKYLYIILTIVTLLGAFLLLFLNRKYPYQNKIEKNKSKSSAFVFWGVLGILLICFGQFLTLELSHLLSGSSFASQNTNQLLTILHQSPFYFLNIVIASPIIEELIFRKVFFGNLTYYFKPWIAAIISSVLFVIAHHDGHFLTYFVMGCILEFIYYKSHDLKGSIISHMGFNLLTIILFGK